MNGGVPVSYSSGPVPDLMSDGPGPRFACAGAWREPGCWIGEGSYRLAVARANAESGHAGPGDDDDEDDNDGGGGGGNIDPDDDEGDDSDDDDDDDEEPLRCVSRRILSRA
jgi:hypothetical protein